MKKKLNTKDFVAKIEKMAKDRMRSGEVVSLQNFRQLKSKTEPATLLLIDDDDTVRGSLRRLLEHDGHRVLSAADGTQLSDVLDDTPIDLIILDVGLPWINGFELAALMREHEELKKIPIIFISAMVSDADIKRGFEVGAADYIKKPFDPSKVQKTVKTILDLAR